MGSNLADAIADLEEQEVLKMVAQRLEAGDEPLSLVEQLRQGMNIVGERYKNKEYFLSELIMASEIFKEAAAVIEPRLTKDSTPEVLGKVVVGTAQGDIHEIGKNILAVLLRSAGFEVHDLGVDVAPQTFLHELKETQAPLLGISGLITPSFEPMKETVQALENAGLREKVKVIIGGGVTTEWVRQYVGADAQTLDAMEGVDLCRKFVKEIRP